MSKPIDAVYENGVLRPLEPLELPDQTHVKVTVTPPPYEQEGSVDSFPRFATPPKARPLTAETVRQALEEAP